MASGIDGSVTQMGGEAPFSRLAFFAEKIFEFGFVLGLAARARLLRNNARRFRLAHALARIRLDGLRRRETGWLAFGHGKQYGIKTLVDSDWPLSIPFGLHALH